MRTRAEINQHYTNVASQFGDMTFKMEKFHKMLDAIKADMEKLADEPASDEQPAPGPVEGAPEVVEPAKEPVVPEVLPAEEVPQAA